MRKYLGAVALATVALIVVSVAAAGTYTSGFESPTFTTTFDNGGTQPAGSVNGQDGWHSAKPGDIPALPNGYDQAIVDNGALGGSGFGDQSLRVSNAVSEKTAEFFHQTYSKSTPDAAGEGQTNTVFDATFEFISTSADYQPGLRVDVSPDNGTGGRMSLVRLQDNSAGGIDITFFETAPDGSFVSHFVGNYSRTDVHTIQFKIEFVADGPDILRLIVDGVDIGDRDGKCFTTWENFYREVSHEPVPVTDSLEFRADNSVGSNDCGLNGAVMNGDTCIVPTLTAGASGYLFDNVTTTTADSGGPAPTTCGLADLNVTKFYDANVNGTKDVGESDITGWKVNVSNGVDPDQIGTTAFAASGLTPGDYTVSEFSPIQSNWHATTATSFVETLAAGDDKTVSFGNVCTGDGGGLTIGFWGNKNGQALLTDARLALLTSLNLRNANGTNFVATSKSVVKNWLSNATATNMAYMLSAQLAAMALNVSTGNVSGSALVYAPGVIQGDDFITVTQLMDAANTALGDDGLTPSGDPNRSYQETLKIALDKANQDNSTIFVQASSCAFSFAS